MHGHMNVKCVIQSVLKTYDVFLLITEANITKSWFNLRIIFFTSGCTVNFSGLKRVQVTSCVFFLLYFTVEARVRSQGSTCGTYWWSE